jgi:hypothetical protein
VEAGARRGRRHCAEGGEHYDASRQHGFHALRHADPGFTLRLYTHVTPSSEEKTRKAIDPALGAEADGHPSSSVPDLHRGGA